MTGQRRYRLWVKVQEVTWDFLAAVDSGGVGTGADPEVPQACGFSSQWPRGSILNLRPVSHSGSALKD